MKTGQTSSALPRILTNMIFVQSRTWSEQVCSIYEPETGPTRMKPYSALKEAAMLWAKRPRFDVVVTMGARESLTYGLLCALTCRDSKQIMTEVFVDEPRPRNPFWHLKTALYRLVARRAIGVLTNSTPEIATTAERFGIPESVIRYVPMHTNIHDPNMQERNDGYVLSAGYTHRDYLCLLEAARQIPAPVVVLCGRRHLRRAELPPNVTVLRDVARDTYLDYLARCALVALPLRDIERSTGQVVLLEAMAMGKPVVTTRTVGTVDYVRDGENALFVPPGNASELAKRVRELLADPERASRLARAALEDIRQYYAIEIHAVNKLRAIRELWESRGKSE
ncbi:MAG: glycosyltransferase family 4 protein [Kiritimatiellae bacterium]|nr:glycosyltransferase family 4 protein [Kiritimatiellia bacterium]